MTTYTFATNAPIELIAKSSAGNLRVAASERADTVVTITARGDATQADIDRVRVVHEGSVVRVDESRGLGTLRRRRASVDIRVEVPASSSATLTVGAGSILTSGTLDAVHARTGAGDVQLDHCASAEVSAGAGDVEISSVQQGARVKCGTGDVVLRALHGGAAHLTSGTGDIRCAIPEGVAAQLDIKTGLGTIRNELTGSDDRPAADRFASVHAKSGTGDIVIERAATVST